MCWAFVLSQMKINLVCEALRLDANVGKSECDSQLNVVRLNRLHKHGIPRDLYHAFILEPKVQGPSADLDLDVDMDLGLWMHLDLHVGLDLDMDLDLN